VLFRSTSSIDGILGYHLGSGKTNIAVRDSTINLKVNEPRGSNGISFLYSGGIGGDLSFDVRDVDIDISSIHGIYRMHDNEEGGRYLDGIWGGYWAEEGDISVDVRRVDIVTKGADSGGMSFIHDRKGDIDIAAPVGPRQQDLSRKIITNRAGQPVGKMMVAADNTDNLQAISDVASEMGVSVGVVIEVDTQMERAGIRAAAVNRWLAVESAG